MADSHRSRYSRSPSPQEARSRSFSRSRSKSRSPSPPRYRSRSRSRSISPSRGRGEVNNPGNTLFVTGLAARVTQRDLEDHFNKEGKSRRKRPRTPTPGHYLGLEKSRESGFGGHRGRGRYRGGYGRDEYDRRRSPRRSPYRGRRGYSPRRSPYAERSRRYRSRSYSPYGSPDRGYGRHSGVYAR